MKRKPMNKSIYIIFLVTTVATLFSQDQKTFNLKDGTVINGTVIEETDTAITIKADYGVIKINKKDLVQKAYEIKLNSGEILSGTKLGETEETITLKTKLGTFDVQKSDILDIYETDKTSQLSEADRYFLNKRSSTLDFLFGTSKTSGKDKEFSMGEERLIDTFFDPTAYVLDDGALYLSGLSFGFGLSDKLMVTTQWSAFFWGDFNLRSKYMLYQKGNWEKESALAIGGHFHTYWQPDKVVWQEGIANICIEDLNWDGDCNDENESGERNFGGYFPIGATIEAHDNYYDDEDLLDVEGTEDLDIMVELFSAYTFSMARKGMRGRISNTVGALVQIPLNHDTYPYRIYWGLDVDITPQLKMLGEAFYDPFFLDISQRQHQDGPFSEHYTYKVEADPVTKDDFKSNRPIHFDFGFIYAVNEHFRFGIHTQPYIIAFYWKL